MLVLERHPLRHARRGLGSMVDSSTSSVVQEIQHARRARETYYSMDRAVPDMFADLFPANSRVAAIIIYKNGVSLVQLWATCSLAEGETFALLAYSYKHSAQQQRYDREYRPVYEGASWSDFGKAYSDRQAQLKAAGFKPVANHFNSYTHNDAVDLADAYGLSSLVDNYISLM